MADPVVVTAKIEKPFRFADFDVKIMKKRIRQQANVVNREAKRLISKKGVSKPGDLPGLQTGRMRKSVKTKVWRSGFGATVRPIMAGGDFYPAFVVYGHRGPKTRTALDNRRHRKTAGPKSTPARANFMYEAVQKVGVTTLQRGMADALDAAIKPVGIL